MTEPQPSAESMIKTSTDMLLACIQDWKKQRDHLQRCIDEAEAVIRKRVGDLAPSTPGPIVPWIPQYPPYPTIPHRPFIPPCGDRPFGDGIWC